MKKILLIFLTYLLILTCSNSKPVKLPDKNLEIKENLIYYKNTLYTGEITGKDLSNNSASFKTSVKNGKIDGKIELLADDIDYYYSISDDKLNGEISILDIKILYKDDVIQKCYSKAPFATKEMVDSFCKIIKENPCLLFLLLGF